MGTIGQNLMHPIYRALGMKVLRFHVYGYIPITPEFLAQDLEIYF